MTIDSDLADLYRALEALDLPRTCVNESAVRWWLGDGKTVAEIVQIVLGTHFRMPRAADAEGA